jgi:RNA polymerase sigma-70 factor (ECF subfamily)
MDATTTDLLARARAGDAHARNQLFSRCRDPLVRWAHGRLPAHARDRYDTDDLVQITFVRTLERMDGFVPRHEGAFLHYMRTILLNQIRDEIRRTARRPAREDLDDNLHDGGPSPLESAMGKDVLERYERALTRLQPDQQEAVILKLELGLGYQEIADKLNRPSANAARLLVTRAVARLAMLMRDLR